jgi:two-component system, NarL family, response regulator DevR
MLSTHYSESSAAPTQVTTNTTRIVVVDSQTLFATALSDLLHSQPGLNVVGVASDVADPKLAALDPNVVLINIDSKLGEASEAILQCRENARQAAICALSNRLEPGLMQRCLAAGAAGYVLQDIVPSELVRVVKSIASGVSYVDPRIAVGLLRRRTMLNSRPELDELSPREMEIVRLIAAGLPNKGISSKLEISDKTVKNHISRIFAKMNFTARTQVAVHAIRTGMA